MDQLDSMRLFVRVVERKSFSAAASDLGIPRSSATTAIKQMEDRLGARLLQRSTRHVAPTPEGEIYYRRCTAILAEIEDAEAALTAREVRGLLRIDVHGPTHHQRLHQIALDLLNNEEEDDDLERLERIDRDQRHQDSKRATDPGAEVGNQLQESGDDAQQEGMGDTEQPQSQRR